MTSDSQFVVLFHEMPAESDRPSHWDFMLKAGEALSTWALQSVPTPEQSISADQLPDHRLAYLEYEGPISGGRGAVRRWDRGACEWLEVSDLRIRIRVAGEKLVGVITLGREAPSDQRWTMRWASGTSD
jgi:hypothetical protein